MFSGQKRTSWRFVSIQTVSLLFFTFAAFSADNPDVVQPKVTGITQVTRDGVSKTNLLSDGSDLYVTEWPAARHIVAKVSLTSGNRRIIQNRFTNVQALDISPDHSKLLISPMQTGGDNEFWVLPVNAGVPKRIGDLVGRDASWSADGHHLLLSKGTKLYMANADGSGAREIYTAAGSVFAPRVSPDGKRVRFTVGNAAQGLTSIWEVGVDGSNPHPAFGNWAGGTMACCGVWSN